MKKVAVLQSNYIPWKGYFDIIHDVDEFVFYDEAQYTKNDWRNRNQIITPQGKIWLTVPVGMDENRTIDEVEIKDNRWQKKHFSTLYMAYHKAPHWRDYESFFHTAYLDKEWKFLYELNRFLIVHIAHDFLHINTKFTDSRDYASHGIKHEKLLSLVKATGASVYVSGPAAKSYIIAEDYAKNGIELVWKDYSGYSIYPQFSKEFTHNVSVLDLLFQTGDDAPQYIWGERRIQKVAE